MPNIKVFISSVSEELKRERDAVEEVISSFELTPNRFETWPADPRAPTEKCLREVEDSDIFIIILGQTISDITISEYEKAREVMPNSCIVFVKDNVNRDEGGNAFYQRLKSETTFNFFTGIPDLKEKVKNGIQHLMYVSLRDRKNGKEKKERRVLMDEKSIAIRPSSSFEKRFDLNEGDHVQGIIEEASKRTFNLYFLNGIEYDQFRNKRSFYRRGGPRIVRQDVVVATIDRIADEDGMFFLVIENRAREYYRSVNINLYCT